MSKESKDGEYPEHLANLSSFKRRVWKDVIRNIPEVEVGVMDDIDLSKRLRERFGGRMYHEELLVTDKALKFSDKLEDTSKVIAYVSFLMWSDKKLMLNQVTEEILIMAYKYNGRLYREEGNINVTIDDLDLTPLDEVMTGGIKRISKETGWEYKYFRELVFVFSKGGNGRDIL